MKLDIIEFNSNSIKIHIITDKPGLLLYTDTWDEGWHAKINGNSIPVVKVFNTYKGVELNKGEHEVELYFFNSVLGTLIILNVGFFFLLLFVTANFSLGYFKNA